MVLSSDQSDDAKAVDAAYQRLQAALASIEGIQLNSSDDVHHAWLEVQHQCSQLRHENDCSDATELCQLLARLLNALATGLLSLRDIDDSSSWLSVSDACLAIATHVGVHIDNCFQSGESTLQAPSLAGCEKARNQVREVYISFLEQISDVYDQLLWYVEDAEWYDWGCTGHLRLHMLRILFVAFGHDSVHHGLLGPGVGMLELTGGSIQSAVSMISYVLSCDEAPHSVQLITARCLAGLTTADAAFLGATGDVETALQWEDAKASIAELTKLLRWHVNGLIQALIDYRILDSFFCCAARYRNEPGKLGPIVQALLTTIHNCLLYCSENQKRLRMHLATQTEVIPGMLVPYFDDVLIPVLGAANPPPLQCSEWKLLEAALQTFVVVTFNLGVFRESFRKALLFPKVLSLCERSGLLSHVSWLELLIKLFLNIDVTLCPGGADMQHTLLQAVEALSSEDLVRLKRRLSTGGNGALPMSKHSRAAVSAMAHILASVTESGDNQSSNAAARRRRNRRNQQRRKRQNKNRWVPKQFGLQTAVAAEAEESCPSDNDSLKGDDDIGVECQPESVGKPEAETDIGDADDNLTCALTGSILQDPITTPDGRHYDRGALEEWIATSGAIDPISGTPLDIASCFANLHIQEAACAAQLGALSQDAVHRLHPSENTNAESLLGALPPLKTNDSKSKKVTLGAARMRHNRSAFAQVPNALRCAIDGKIMSDPIRSPHGHAFERRTLERWVSCCGSICPITSKALSLNDCWSDVELQQEIRDYIKQRRQESQRRPSDL